MKVCFDFACDEAVLFAKVADNIAAEGISVVGITMGSRWSNGWLGKFKNYNINLGTLNTEVDIASEVERISNEYSNFSLSSFLQADRFLSKFGREEQLSALVHTFIVLERMIKKEKIDMFFSTGVAYLYNLVAHTICKQNSIPFISFYHTRQPEPRFTISTSHGGHWDLVGREYASIVNGGEILEEERLAVLAYINDFRKKSLMPGYMNAARQSSSLKMAFIKEFFVRLEKYYIKGWGRNKGDYITKNPFWYAFRDGKRIILSNLFTRISNQLFDRTVEKEKFYIFPLHLQPEASTLVLSKYYVNQLEVIRNVAKIIPFDSVLYVKEHPSAFGRHSYSFYKEIKKLYNVKLIAPWESSRKLISQSKGVVVLSGTMGWEAFLLGKPSYVLGSVFYDVFSGVNKVSGYDELEMAIKNNCTSPEENDILKACVSLSRGSFSGWFDVHKIDTSSKVLSPENIKEFTFGVKRVIKLFS